MARFALLLLAVTGCLEAPPEGGGDDDDDAGGGHDSGTVTTPDGAPSCGTLVKDDFAEATLDGGIWMQDMLGMVESDILDEKLAMSARGGSGFPTAAISIESLVEHTLEDTHVVATFATTDDSLAVTDAGITWFRAALMDYYAVFVRDDEVRATYRLAVGDEVALCEPGQCLPYFEGEKVTVTMTATADTVMLSAETGPLRLEFGAAPNSGLTYAVRAGVSASEPATMQIEVDDVTWYGCLPE